MRNPARLFIFATIGALLSTPALGQTSVIDSNKFAWSENCGWLNFRDAGAVPGAQGARFLSSFASGFVWSENTGWINLGDGTPANGVAYANTTGADFGVNINATTRELSGLAWGENVGWINFSGGALATPPHPARIDTIVGRLRGYAWGENIGWINLDDSGQFVRTKCPADHNNSNLVSVQDVFDFLVDWFAPNPAADFNFSSTVTVQDVFDFLAAWFAGC